MTKQKVALVLSGGAALGAVELGILSVLETQYEFDFYVGTSIGSMISVFLAMGKTVSEIFAIFNQDTVKDLMLSDMSTTGFGLIRGKKFLSFLQSSFEQKTFADFQTPMTFVATDFVNGDRINISEGSIAEAVRASCGVPILFQPYKHSKINRWLVDGGLCQNFPLDIALNQYDGNIIGIDVGTFIDESEDFSQTSMFSNFKNLSPTIQRTIRIMMRHQHDFSVSDRVRILKPNVSDFSPLKFKQKDFNTMFDFGRKFALAHKQESLF